MDIEKRIKKVPQSPGVYIFLGKNREILYIGKASNLRKRLSSYFQKTHYPPRVASLISQIDDLDYIPTQTSAEALIYEAGLIKEKKPKYNIELKDDKSYPFLKLTINEKYPRLFMTRGKKNDGAVYYGPYTNVKLLRRALSVIRNIFLFRSCNNLPRKACLKAYIKQCVAPCDGSISETEYRKIVDEVRLFLEGRKDALLKDLSEKMKKSAKDMEYEKALIIRDRIEALSAMWKERRPPTQLNREISELRNNLGLPVLPARIEAFDISNIHGKEAVGSMVSFFTGRPQKDEYRRFRIKEIRGIDDYAMIREVVKRRYTRLLRERKKLPDLILIDGGKGHLNTARSELDKITGLPYIPVISIAKGKEEVFLEGRKEPLRLVPNSRSLKLLMWIRNEAHRFAISYHKLLRKKSQFHRVGGTRSTYAVELAPTAFEKRVYRVIATIPKGETRSYKWVAEKIKTPKAYRAVGQALNKNPYIGVVPCHRVIKSDGSLGGFAKGKNKKIKLLKGEGIDLHRDVKYNGKH